MTSEDWTVELRAALVSRRAALKLTQGAAGALCDPPICQQTLSKMESGTDASRMTTVARYARQALGLRLVLRPDRVPRV